MKKRIVIFASGSGTNTQNIMEHFQQGELAEVVLVLSNKKNAKVLDRAKIFYTKASSFTKEELNSEEGVLKTLKFMKPDLIVLAGFLLKIPPIILVEFPNKIINIHPALLPKYGGKGMYGAYVHEAVVANKEAESGITIHYVNEKYDEGAIIFQESITISEEDSAAEVAAYVQELEYDHFPRVIENILRSEKN